MSEHTKQPWGWQYFGELHLVGQHGRRPVVLCARSGDLQTRGENGLLIPLTPEHPNAVRIVACVNACAGLNPEAIPKLVEACEEWATYTGDIRVAVARADKLKAALKALKHD